MGAMVMHWTICLEVIMLAAVMLRDRLAGYRSSLNAGTLSLHYFPANGHYQK